MQGHTDFDNIYILGEKNNMNKLNLFGEGAILMNEYFSITLHLSEEGTDYFSDKFSDELQEFKKYKVQEGITEFYMDLSIAYNPDSTIDDLPIYCISYGIYSKEYGINIDRTVTIQPDSETEKFIKIEVLKEMKRYSIEMLKEHQRRYIQEVKNK